ncbi:MAG: ribosome small subunit-dependent GTPase A [Anaerolineaceae bacterium 4572_32.2]|nr:MAG: ribosome small subunit-dependent GTPase A [Anaerolineaceae bacterium 4572_32.2]
MNPDLLDGLVIKAQSGFFTVHTDAGNFVCQVRGRLKQERRDTDLLATGDRVRISLTKDDRGMIEEIAERKRAMARLAPIARGRGSRRWSRDGYLSEREQVIVANPDQVIIVFACAEPAPSLRMLDRLLVGAEVQEIPVVVCANKIDLVSGAEASALFGIYAEIGYPVLYTSAVAGNGVSALHDALRGKLSALVGPSGTGKTSLLNAIQPGLGLRVRDVSRATSKGRHTTVVPQLLPLDVGGWVADTPGIRTLALFDVDPEDLDAYFPDIAPLVAHCRFSDCAHTVEPGCAVIQAVEEGKVSAHRHESYVRLRDEHQKLADMYWWGIKED